MFSTAVVTASSKIPSWWAPPESTLVAVEPGDFGFSAGLPGGPVLRNLLQGREAWSVALEFLFEELALTPQTADEHRNRRQQGTGLPQSADVPKPVLDRLACSQSDCRCEEGWTVQQVCRHEEEAQAMHWQAGQDQRGAAELRRQAEEDRREAAELRRQAEQDRHVARMARGQAEELQRQAERAAITAQASKDAGERFACGMLDQGPLFSSAKALLKCTEAGNAEPQASLHDQGPLVASAKDLLKRTDADSTEPQASLHEQGPLFASAKDLLKRTEADGAKPQNSVHDQGPLFASAKDLLNCTEAGRAEPHTSIHAATREQEGKSVVDPDVRKGDAKPSAMSLLSTEVGGDIISELEAFPMFQKATNLVSGAATETVPAKKANATFDLQPNLGALANAEEPLLFGPEARAPFKPPRLSSASLGRSAGVSRGAPPVALALADAETASSFIDNGSCLGPEARTPFKPPRPLERSMPANMGAMTDVINFKAAADGDHGMLGPTARKQFKRPRVSATSVGSDVGC